MKSALLLAVTALLAVELPAQETADTEPLWLTYAGVRPADAEGRTPHVVLIAADQEYRSEQAMPMLAKILATHHGFDCTVLFSVNDDGLVDPTLPIKWENKEAKHHIPGLEKLADADLMILFSRLITLPDDEVQHIVDYVDSGKPLIAIRTANHGFLGFPYELDGKKLRFGEDVLGGAFRNHHGGWHREATRGIVIEEQREHPILTGVEDVWGPSDVYRTYEEGGALPETCTALLLGQPLKAREPDSPPNTDKEALPVAWTNAFTGSTGQPSRVFHSTMGSARDLQCADLRRMYVNAAYWCLGLEDRISADSSVDYVGVYDPLPSGFDYAKLGVKPRPVADYR